jgi:hypothetical protein
MRSNKALQEEYIELAANAIAYPNTFILLTFAVRHMLNGPIEDCFCTEQCHSTLTLIAFKCFFERLFHGIVCYYSFSTLFHVSHSSYT